MCGSHIHTLTHTHTHTYTLTLTEPTLKSLPCGVCVCVCVCVYVCLYVCLYVCNVSRHTLMLDSPCIFTHSLSHLFSHRLPSSRSLSLSRPLSSLSLCLSLSVSLSVYFSLSLSLADASILLLFLSISPLPHLFSHLPFSTTSLHAESVTQHATGWWKGSLDGVESRFYRERAPIFLI